LVLFFPRGNPLFPLSSHCLPIPTTNAFLVPCFSKIFHGLTVPAEDVGAIKPPLGMHGLHFCQQFIVHIKHSAFSVFGHPRVERDSPSLKINPIPGESQNFTLTKPRVVRQGDDRVDRIGQGRLERKELGLLEDPFRALFSSSISMCGGSATFLGVHFRPRLNIAFRAASSRLMEAFAPPSSCRALMYSLIFAVVMLTAFIPPKALARWVREVLSRWTDLLSRISYWVRKSFASSSKLTLS
jgi:hypothetical protein